MSGLHFADGSVRYFPSAMFAETIAMPPDVEVAFRRLLDLSDADDRVADDPRALSQATRAGRRWGRIRQWLLDAGSATARDGFLWLRRPFDPEGLVARPDLGTAEWRRLRQSVFARDGYACRYCGATGVPLRCDHVVPWSRGGDNRPDNLATACQPCNSSKGALTPAEWEARRGR